MRKLLLSVVAAASLGAGLIATAGTAEAYHHGYHHNGVGFGLFFGSPGYYGSPYYGDPFYGRNYRWRNAYTRCHIERIRYHGRWHKARVCGGRIARIY
jgi:hypothetical protein